jgi:acetyl-CoA carboxylase biotin carboxyl carrier protein
MTAGDAPRLAVPEQPAGRTETADLLHSVRDCALGLLAGMDRPPSSLRIRADAVEIQLDWPQPAAAAVAGGTGPAPAPVTALEPLHSVDSDTADYVTAHMVGVFYRAPEPGAQPFVDVGDVIEPGQQVGIIEAMKLMMPVEADLAGRVVEVLAANGAPVEYGDRLLAIEPVDS